MITDNLSSHNSLEATTWLSAHPRLHHVFIPTRAGSAQFPGGLVGSGGAFLKPLVVIAASFVIACNEHSTREFRQLMINGMQPDHSWASAGQHYLNIYEYIRHK